MSQNYEPYEKRAKVLLESFSSNGDDYKEAKIPDELHDVEKCVIYMRMCGLSYGSIQYRLGMIPKKQIKAILNAYNPELINIDVNHHKIPKDLWKGYDWNWETFKKRTW